MGYDTDFEGFWTLDRPLDAVTAAMLCKCEIKVVQHHHNQ
jgi:hypothetical protein